jgi:DNA-binding transcriptional MocR family regulator
MARGAVQTEQTLVEQCVQWVTSRIHEQVFRPGMRVPSIRTLARGRGVSPFTIVEAYERLVASGYLEPRKGSGFYVRRRAAEVPASLREVRPTIDLTWLMSHMLQRGQPQGPGLGVLPSAWLDGARIADAVRALGRQGVERWLESGSAYGYEPLRAVLQERLARLDIVVRPEQIVLTTGITHALNLVLRNLIVPGDAVLTLDPCWFGALGLLASHGARIIGIPHTGAEPDLALMERAMREERPKLMVISSAAQNPTGLSLAPATIAGILQLAEHFQVPIFEDDVYGDLCTADVRRFAAADRSGRVIYAGSFSKTMAANIRVGFIAARVDRVQALVDAKILTGFTTPELNERLLHKLLVEGRYARHLERLRDRLARQRAIVLRALANTDLAVLGSRHDGMFVWVDTRTDTNELAARWRNRGLLLAPGSLFSPQQTPTTWMRFNVTTPIAGSVRDLLRSLHAVRTRQSVRALRSDP